MSNNFKKGPPSPDAVPEAERRRSGSVVYDDRGNASWDFRDAPPDFKRPLLEVLGDPQMTVKNEETYDPYARARTRPSGGNTTRTDLRKLGEWIKMMRELEARKSRGDDDEE
ncbi:MAG TPA: hypothetical protein VKB72_16205 [Steroidobacteraceae bacterium]|nr:hypothetical protein [Steroidobacteraceae bacterium]